MWISNPTGSTSEKSWIISRTIWVTCHDIEPREIRDYGIAPRFALDKRSRRIASAGGSLGMRPPGVGYRKGRRHGSSSGIRLNNSPDDARHRTQFPWRAVRLSSVSRGPAVHARHSGCRPRGGDPGPLRLVWRGRGMRRPASQRSYRLRPRRAAARGGESISSRSSSNSRRVHGMMSAVTCASHPSRQARTGSRSASGVSSGITTSRS